MESLRLFFRVLSLGRSERKLQLLFVIAAACIGTLQILEPVVFGRVIDALSRDGRLAHDLVLWVVLGALNAGLSIFLSIATDRFAHRQRQRALELAFERTISLPYRHHSLHGSGKVVRTIQAGADHVFSVTLSCFRENLLALGSVLVLVPLAVALDARLATALFALAFIYTLCNGLVIRRTRKDQAAVEVKHQNLAARIVDVMGTVAVVRCFTRVRREVELFRALAAETLHAQYPVLAWWGALNVITRLSAMVAMVAIVAVGSALVQAGEATGGQVVTFVGFSTLLIGRLDQLSAFVNRLAAQQPTAHNLFALLDDVAEEERLTGTFDVAPPRGHVVFDRVSFRYGGPCSSSQGVFALDFAVKPGETFALVGPTGSGKSTCLALLQRLYAPDSGRILIDGHDIQDLSVEALCGSIATVFQEPGLFNRSIYDNILVGRPTATRGEVEDAARRADAHDFILARPGGYDFIVGERGLALSGGERQRLAIARAILKDAPILVLDEATSALDNETEKRVQTAMDRLSRGKTTFVIAHRLSTVLAADRILVMQDGRIVQAGTFAELRTAVGLFARLLHAGGLDGIKHPPRAGAAANADALLSAS